MFALEYALTTNTHHFILASKYPCNWSTKFSWRSCSTQTSSCIGSLNLSESIHSLHFGSWIRGPIVAGCKRASISVEASKPPKFRSATAVIINDMLSSRNCTSNVKLSAFLLHTRHRHWCLNIIQGRMITFCRQGFPYVNFSSLLWKFVLVFNSKGNKRASLEIWFENF